MRLALLLSSTALLALASAGCASTPERPITTVPTQTHPSSDGVRIARWTPPDIPADEVTEATFWIGDLIIDDGCLALTDPQGNLLLVFPYGIGDWDVDTETLTYNGDVYQIGDDMLLIGGWATRGSDKFGEGDQSIPSCGVDRLFLVDWVRRS